MTSAMQNKAKRLIAYHTIDAQKSPGNKSGHELSLYVVDPFVLFARVPP